VGGGEKIQGEKKGLRDGREKSRKKTFTGEDHCFQGKKIECGEVGVKTTREEEMWTYQEEKSQ